MLLAKTRTVCRKKQYKHVRTNNSEILVRKEMDSNEDLSKTKFNNDFKHLNMLVKL